MGARDHGWLGGLLAVWLVSLAPSYAQDSAETRAVAAVGPGVVLITTTDRQSQPRASGTGFLIDPRGFVATCAHLLEDAATITVTLADHTRLTARRIALDQEHDLAILQLPRDTPCEALDQRTRAAQEGRAVLLTGYTSGGKPSDGGKEPAVATVRTTVTGFRGSRGFFSQMPMRLLQLDTKADPGSCGGPVYHPGRGEIAGVISSGVGHLAGTGSGLDLAIPVRYLLDLYDDVLTGKITLPVGPVKAPPARVLQDKPRVLTRVPDAVVTELPLLEPELAGGGFPIKAGWGRMLSDAARSRLYVCEVEANALTVVSTDSFTCLKRVSAGLRPVGIALSLDGSELYVALAGSRQLRVLDAETLALKRAFGCEFTPYELALAAPDKLYLSSAGRGLEGVYLINPRSGEYSRAAMVYGEAALVARPDTGLVLAGERHLSPSQIYRCDSQNKPTSFEPSVGHGAIGSNLQDICVSPDGRRLYVCCGFPYRVQVLDTTTFASVGNLETGPYPRQVAVSPDGTRVFATHCGGHVDVFDALTFTRQGSIAVKGEVTDMLVTSTGLLVLAFGEGLWFVDLATMRLDPA